MDYPDHGFSRTAYCVGFHDTQHHGDIARPGLRQKGDLRLGIGKLGG